MTEEEWQVEVLQAKGDLDRAFLRETPNEATIGYLRLHVQNLNAVLFQGFYLYSKLYMKRKPKSDEISFEDLFP